MSEYQYYEFLAVDRPLDKQAQAEVRALSTRARITATGLRTLTAPQRALADFLRLDEDLLAVDELAGDEEAAWARVHAMIATRTPNEYDNAVRLLTDLLWRVGLVAERSNYGLAGPLIGPSSQFPGAFSSSLR